MMFSSFYLQRGGSCQNFLDQLLRANRGQLVVRYGGMQKIDNTYKTKKNIFVLFSCQLLMFLGYQNYLRGVGITPSRLQHALEVHLEEAWISISYSWPSAGCLRTQYLSHILRMFHQAP